MILHAPRYVRNTIEAQRRLLMNEFRAKQARKRTDIPESAALPPASLAGVPGFRQLARQWSLPGEISNGCVSDYSAAHQTRHGSVLSTGWETPSSRRVSFRPAERSPMRRAVSGRPGCLGLQAAAFGQAGALVNNILPRRAILQAATRSASAK